MCSQINTSSIAFKGNTQKYVTEFVKNRKLLKAVVAGTAATAGFVLAKNGLKADNIENELRSIPADTPAFSIQQDYVYRPFNTKVNVPGAYFKKDIKNLYAKSKPELINLVEKKTRNLPEKVEKLEAELQAKGYEQKEKSHIGGRDQDIEFKTVDFLDKTSGELLKRQEFCDGEKTFEYYYVYDNNGNLSQKISTDSITMYTYNKDGKLTGSFNATNLGDKYLTVNNYGEGGSNLQFEMVSYLPGSGKSFKTNITGVKSVEDLSAEYFENKIKAVLPKDEKGNLISIKDLYFAGKKDEADVVLKNLMDIKKEIDDKKAYYDEKEKEYRYGNSKKYLHYKKLSDDFHWNVYVNYSWHNMREIMKELYNREDAGFIGFLVDENYSGKKEFNELINAGKLKEAENYWNNYYLSNLRSLLM